MQQGGLGREGFLWGRAGPRKGLKSLEACNGGQVGYVGESNLHPDGAGMSSRDAALLATIAEEMRIVTWPGVMMIVGEGGRVGFSTRGW